MRLTVEDMKVGCIDAANFWPKSVSEYVGDGTRKTSEQLIEIITKMTKDAIECLFQDLIDDEILILEM